MKLRERAILYGMIIFRECYVAADQVKNAETLLKSIGLYKNVHYSKTNVPAAGSFTVDMVKYKIVNDR